MRGLSCLPAALGVWLTLTGCTPQSSPHVGPAWLDDARIFVQGYGVANEQCQTAICQHNENTDLTVWNGDTWLIHRTAKSQILGDDCSLNIYRSKDHGGHFSETAKILPIPGRDLRDPHFYTIGDQLYFEAITRMPVTSERDSNVDSTCYAWRTSDGVNWEMLPDPLLTDMWSLWRPKLDNGVWYSAAYHDGDSQVTLFSSTDGAHFTQGADIYTVSADTPLETELVFMPSGTLMALVRMDGSDQELLGSEGRLRTAVCTAQPPYAQFDCSQVLSPFRFDGPLAFYWEKRLFMVARKHIGEDGRKRTALWELAADDDGRINDVKEWGEIPSAGDTSYAGGAVVDANHVLLSWYSGDLVLDQSWIIGILDASDIWLGTIDFTQLK